MNEDALPVTSMCPYCEYRMDSATGVPEETARPKAGDLALCLNCGGMLIFTIGLKSRAMTIDEEARMTWEERHEIYRSQAIIRQRGRFLSLVFLALLIASAVHDSGVVS